VVSTRSYGLEKMKADWWRAWHGMAADPKWTIIARRAKVARGIALAVAVTLLERASEAEDRGSINGFKSDVIAELVGVDSAKVDAIVAAMRMPGGVLSGDRFSAWEKRQPAREREDGGSSERVRRHRANKAAEAQNSVAAVETHVTPCNATKRLESESDSDKTRLGDDSARERAREGVSIDAAMRIGDAERALEVDCRAMVEGLPVSVDTNFVPILRLLDAGITRDDILGGVREAVELRSIRARSWSLFERFIREKAKDRLERAHGVVLDLGDRRRSRSVSGVPRRDSGGAGPRPSNLAVAMAQLGEIRAEEDAIGRSEERPSIDGLGQAAVQP
jgi:hypothetical protein